MNGGKASSRAERTALLLTFVVLACATLVFVARDTLGTRVSIVAGLLLACVPSFLWIARHDWGSFSLALRLHCAEFLCVTRGWQRGSVSLGLVGGACLGLGVYNRIDFGVSTSLVSVPGPKSWPTP